MKANTEMVLERRSNVRVVIDSVGESNQFVDKYNTSGGEGVKKTYCTLSRFLKTGAQALRAGQFALLQKDQLCHIFKNSERLN